MNLERSAWILRVVVLLVATTGLVYELVAAAVASWVIGDTALQFTTIIGTYLAALGLGAYGSRWFEHELPRRFIQIELAVALVGALNTPLLLYSVAYVGSNVFRVLLYSSVAIIGSLVGLEIPILTRILSQQESFSSLVAKILAVDHLGSLLGSLLFTFVLMPHGGPIQAAILCGVLNAVVALSCTWILSQQISKVLPLRFVAIVTVLFLSALLVVSNRWTERLDDSLSLISPSPLPLVQFLGVSNPIEQRVHG